MAEPRTADRRTGRIVLVDDDTAFLAVLGDTIRSAGHDVTSFDDPRQALNDLIGGIRPDACVMDWNMPGLSGLELLKSMRAHGIEVPVLFLTSYGQAIFEEAALDAGAVDFIDKTRSPAIVLHRLALALDRNLKQKPQQAKAAPADLRIGELVLSRSSKRATWHAVPVPLSQNEFDVVTLLAENAGRDVGYRQIHDLIHGEGFIAGQGEHGYRANVRAAIKRIRRKFTQVDADFAALDNYPGFGYRWNTNAR